MVIIQDSNPRPVNRKSDAISITPPCHLLNSYESNLFDVYLVLLTINTLRKKEIPTKLLLY